MKTIPAINNQVEQEYLLFGVPYADAMQYPEASNRVKRFWKDVEPSFRDMAQPRVRVVEKGEKVQLLWFNLKRDRVLIVHLGSEFTPDGLFRVTEERHRYYHSALKEPMVTEKGKLPIREIVPLALRMTSGYRPSRWRPTGFIKNIGPWELEVRVHHEMLGGSRIDATLRRDGKVVLEERHLTWEKASERLHKAMGEILRGERNHARTSQYAKNYLEACKQLGHGVNAV